MNLLVPTPIKLDLCYDLNHPSTPPMDELDKAPYIKVTISYGVEDYVFGLCESSIGRNQIFKIIAINAAKLADLLNKSEVRIYPMDGILSRQWLEIHENKNILFIGIDHYTYNREEIEVVFPRTNKKMKVQSSDNWSASLVSTSFLFKLIRNKCYEADVKEKVCILNCNMGGYTIGASGLIEDNFFVMGHFLCRVCIEEYFKLLINELKLALKDSKEQNIAVRLLHDHSRFQKSVYGAVSSLASELEEAKISLMFYENGIKTNQDKIKKLEDDYDKWVKHQRAFIPVLLTHKKLNSLSIILSNTSNSRINAKIASEVNYLDLNDDPTTVNFGVFTVSFSDDGLPKCIGTTSKYNYEGKTHPHVAEDSICFGDFRGIIERAKRDNDYANLIIATIALLQSYYEPDAYIKMESLTHGKYLNSADVCDTCEDSYSPFCIMECRSNEDRERFPPEDCNEYGNPFCVRSCRYRNDCGIETDCNQANTNFCHYFCSYFADCDYYTPYCEECPYDNYDIQENEVIFPLLCYVQCQFNAIRHLYVSSKDMTCFNCTIKSICAYKSTRCSHPYFGVIMDKIRYENKQVFIDHIIHLFINDFEARDFICNKICKIYDCEDDERKDCIDTITAMHNNISALKKE